ncbi:MAG: HAMP domain-containing sensor histidine kinase, partial [Polyangiaceae bacterium]
LQLDRSLLNASELVLTASDDAKVIQKRKAITVTLDVPSGIKANADRRWLSAAVAEIIANGIKHAKTSVKVVATFEAGKLTIVTHDDGRGFSDEAFAALSGPRFARSGARAGLGISLGLARDVAKAHGGDLRVVKSPDGGHVELELSEK